MPPLPRSPPRAGEGPSAGDQRGPQVRGGQGRREAVCGGGRRRLLAAEAAGGGGGKSGGPVPSRPVPSPPAEERRSHTFRRRF